MLPAESPSAGKWLRCAGLQLFPSTYNFHSFLLMAKETVLGDVQGMPGQCTVETLFGLAAWLFLSCCQSQLSGQLVQKEKVVCVMHIGIQPVGVCWGRELILVNHTCGLYLVFFLFAL